MGEDEIASAFDEDDDDLPRMTYAQALKTPGISLEMLRRIGDREIRRAAEETFAAARAARESRPIEQDPAWVMRSTVLNGGTHG